MKKIYIIIYQTPDGQYFDYEGKYNNTRTFSTLKLAEIARRNFMQDKNLIKNVHILEIIETKE